MNHSLISHTVCLLYHCNASYSCIPGGKASSNWRPLSFSLCSQFADSLEAEQRSCQVPKIPLGVSEEDHNSSLITSGLPLYTAGIPREHSTSGRLELVEEECTKYKDSKCRKAGWEWMAVRFGMGEKDSGHADTWKGKAALQGRHKL